MEILLSTMKFWCWLPIFFWVGLYFWFLRVSYPTYLKDQLTKGQKWVFLPKHKFYWKLGDGVFSFISIVTSAAPVIWALLQWTSIPFFYGFAVCPLFIVLAKVLSRIAKSKTAEIFHSAYFLEYRKVRYQTEVKGNFRNEADVHNQTIWSFTKKMRNAEKHGRLWKYVNAMASTKKIPPDVYAETMYV